jgi:hypothetical protein
MVFNPRRNRLFHAVLQNWLVNQRKHLLGDHFGRRQKARAQAACGEYCLPNPFAHPISFISNFVLHKSAHLLTH